MSGKNEQIRVLIVDDVDTNRFVLKDIIAEAGYQPILAENGQQALRVVEHFPLNLIITDIAMPVMDGYEFCRTLKDNPKTREIPIIFISAFDDPSDVLKGFQMGGADYVTKPFIPEVVRARVELHLKIATATAAAQELNRKLQISMKEQLEQVENEKKNVLYALLRVGQANAAYDRNHMERVRTNCRTLAEALQLCPEYEDRISDYFVDTLEMAAPLCDLGNVAISTDILQRPNHLTPQEEEVMEKHTLIGARILADVEKNTGNNDFVHMSWEIAQYHHENWDGSGYPLGTKGEDIPLAAQIVSVAGVYSSLTEERTYRRAYSQQEALEEMQKEAGTKFNPVIFAIFQKIARQLC